MSDVRKFPSKGLFRDDDDRVAGIYQGYTRKEAEAKLANVQAVMRGMGLAMQMAEARGYASLFEVPEAERFEIVSEAERQMNHANDEGGTGK